MFEDSFRFVIKKNLKQSVLLAVSLTLIALMSVASSTVLMKIIDDVLPQQNMSVLLKAVAVFIVIALMQGVVSYLSSLANSALLLRSTNGLKVEMLQKILRKDGKYFAANSRGEIYNSIENDSSRFSAFVISNFSSVFMTIVSLLVAIVYLGILDWKLVLLILALQPTSLLFQAMMRPKIIRISEKVRAFTSEYDTLTQEIVEDPSELILSGHVQSLISRFKEKTETAVRLGMKSTVIQMMSANIGQFLNSMTLCAVIAYSGWSIIRGSMGIGEMIIFVTYSQRIVDSIENLLNFSIDVSDITPIHRKIHALMYSEEREKQQEPAVSAEPVIETKQLNFAYDDRSRAIFNNFTYQFCYGKHYGIVGKTGSGKSTLARLIYGLWEPDQGSVTVDGISAGEIAYTDMDQIVTYISSSPLILNDTVRNNLTMFDSSVSDEQIWNVLRKMRLDDVIRESENKLDTKIGESGLRLSAGQRQRLVLARGMLSGKRIIILDEPTSALDTETAKHVTDEIYNTFADRTLIIITHDPKILDRCHAVLRIEDGTVSEISRTK